MYRRIRASTSPCQVCFRLLLLSLLFSNGSAGRRFRVASRDAILILELHTRPAGHILYTINLLVSAVVSVEKKKNTARRREGAKVWLALAARERPCFTSHGCIWFRDVSLRASNYSYTRLSPRYLNYRSNPFFCISRWPSSSLAPPRPGSLLPGRGRWTAQCSSTGCLWVPYSLSVSLSLAQRPHQKILRPREISPEIYNFEVGSMLNYTSPVPSLSTVCTLFFLSPRDTHSRGPQRRCA